jgi:hypothetical protein
MTNPFEKRATEYLRDDAAFLSVVTPEPLYSFFEKYATDGSLYDRLSMVIGTPGSGKTTIATLLQFGTVHALLNSPNHSEYGPLVSALSKCRIIEAQQPKIIGCRIAMESEYRDFWQLPYSEEIRIGLLKSFLQSRAVISWLSSLGTTGQYDLEATKIAYRENGSVARESIGGESAKAVLKKAIDIERHLYDVVAALVPPREKDLPTEILAPYHPFDNIQAIITVDGESQEQKRLRPLVMLDDVHSLHPSQLSSMRDWLARREMPISRWMLMRIDAQTPEAVLNEGVTSNAGIEVDSTIKRSREITFIWLQSIDDRASSRRRFRKMAKGMADKYLRLMPALNRQGLVHIQDLLSTKPESISDSKLKKLEQKVSSAQKLGNIRPEVRKTLEEEIERYFSGTSSQDIGEDVKLAMLHILLHRYIKRVPQASLFDDEGVEEAPIPNKKITADSGVADGAKILLLHEYNRPYYYGIDTVCDGSSENAEQFLQLSGRLVEASEARVIRGKRASLPAKYQHQLLTYRSEAIIREWIFPRHEQVGRLCDYIADQCVAKSLEPNAPLGGGANAIGILEDEFKNILKKHAELAHVIKYGVAYNALAIKRQYKTKNRMWTLIELTGPLLIAKGLTLARGGFIEREVRDLTKALEEE